MTVDEGCFRPVLIEYVSKKKLKKRRRKESWESSPCGLIILIIVLFLDIRGKKWGLLQDAHLG